MEGEHLLTKSLIDDDACTLSLYTLMVATTTEQVSISYPPVGKRSFTAQS